MDDDIQEPKIIDRPDGFFGVEGMPETSYYPSREVAERVARALGEKLKADRALQAQVADDHSCETG